MPRLTMKTLSNQLADQEIQIEALTLAANNDCAQIGAMYRSCISMAQKIEQLTQLAARQAEVIATLTSKLEELAESNNTVAEEMVRAHRRLDRTDYQTFTLSESNANRLELHGKWISDLFNRINESEVKE